MIPSQHCIAVTSGINSKLFRHVAFMRHTICQLHGRYLFVYVLKKLLPCDTNSTNLWHQCAPTHDYYSNKCHV